MRRSLLLSLLVALGCASTPRPPELLALDEVMKDSASLSATDEAAQEEVNRARAEYDRANTAFADGDIEDSVYYAELADLSMKTAMEKLRGHTAALRSADAKRVSTDAEKRLADAVDSKDVYERRIVRMEKIAALEANLESEKAASRAQKAKLERELAAAQEAQQEALKQERVRRELAELIAAVRSKVETAVVMNASEHAPRELEGAQDTLALAQRALVGDQFNDARTLIASADESAAQAIVVARREYKARNERLGLLQERDTILEEATAIVSTSATQERGVVVTLYKMFAPGEAEILAEKKATLDALAKLAKNYAAYPLLVEGYTDSQGREKTNLELSEQRARSVLDYLVSRGIDTARSRSAGYGESKPVADNSTSEGRAKNRRVEFVLLFP